MTSVKKFLDYDKDIPSLLNDLDTLSQNCGTNDKANTQNIIIAIGKHAGIVRILSESTDKVSREVKNLTWILSILTIILAGLTVAILMKM
jgi:hypothetical protein